jgi:uncharacterized RDD family membrane protein YckC
MSAVAESPDRESIGQATPEGEVRTVGIVTRAVSWVIDAVLINLVAIFAGVGAALVLSIFPLAKNLQPAFEVVAGGAYVVWCAVYFVAFWSITGQTPGARVMQIRLVTANLKRVKPVRTLVRWVGMNLAMLPLFAGYIPILFGRRGFPDWLAKTRVLDTPETSLAQARRDSMRAANEGSRQRPPVTSPDPEWTSAVSGDGRGLDGSADRAPGRESSQTS